MGDWPRGSTSLDAALTRLLVEAGSVVVRASDEQTLFDRVCRLLVEHGGFRFAWLGLAEPAGDRLSEAAVYGRDSIDVEGFRRLALSGESRRAVLSRARAREPGVLADATDLARGDAEGPWATAPFALGVGSVALLPIASDRLVQGVIIIASDNPGYFAAHRLERLGRLAGDVAVKLDGLGRHAAIRACDEALRRAHSRLRAFWDDAPDAILILSGLGLQTNATFATMFPEAEGRELRLRDLQFFFSSELVSRILAAYRKGAAARSAPARFASRALRSDGTSFPVFVQARWLELDGTWPAYAVSVADLSE